MLGFGYDHTQVVVTDNCWFIVLGLLLLTIRSMGRYAIKFTVFSVFVRRHLADVGNKCSEILRDSIGLCPGRGFFAFDGDILRGLQMWGQERARLFLDSQTPIFPI